MLVLALVCKSLEYYLLTNKYLRNMAMQKLLTSGEF